MDIRCKIVSSLEKIRFDFPLDACEMTEGIMMKNEIHSFQLVCEMTDTDRAPGVLGVGCRLEVVSDIRDYISLYKVEDVPSHLPANADSSDDDYISKEPGYFPDPLRRLNPRQEVRHANGQCAAIWVAVEPQGKVSGVFPITINLYGPHEKLMTSLTYTVTILDIELPALPIKCTGWFHGDSIATLHHVAIGSEAYTAILDKYLAVYVKFGHNMILTPIFTPALDTAVGAERMTNQLVDVTVTDGVYDFDFTHLGEWIDRCRKHGITYFEIAHLFTQWGAGFTPKIMATVDGVYTRIFGWDVEALSDKYKSFLHAFLPRLVAYLKERGVYEQCMFHISDEPAEAHAEQYAGALAVVSQYIEKEKLMDAISDYLFYEKGLIANPVPSNDHIKAFLEHDVPNLWTYYCCCQGVEVANRFMAMPSYRNRILGYQLYKHNIAGFLQWGFNFWFSLHSQYVIDPYRCTDAGNTLPSGDAFMVYPLDEYGEVVASLRLYVFNEGLQDLRALTLLESFIGREAVDAMLTDIVGFNVYPRRATYILALREAINRRIMEHLS